MPSNISSFSYPVPPSPPNSFFSNVVIVLLEFHIIFAARLTNHQQCQPRRLSYCIKSTCLFGKNHDIVRFIVKIMTQY